MYTHAQAASMWGTAGVNIVTDGQRFWPYCPSSTATAGMAKMYQVSWPYLDLMSALRVQTHTRKFSLTDFKVTF